VSAPIRREGRWLLVPLQRLVEPPAGAVRADALIDHHWLVDAQDRVRFWIDAGEFSPQANVSRAVVESLLERKQNDWAVRTELVRIAFVHRKPTEEEA